MASIWFRLNGIPTDELMSVVVIPFIRALADQGIHLNLEPTKNSLHESEGNLTYALFPEGELGFYFKTGPQMSTLTGEMDPDRYAMATVSGLPSGYQLTEENVSAALSGFQRSLLERGIYEASARITDGSSFGGRVRTVGPRGAGSGSSPSADSSGGPRSGCYIATAVYGGYDAAPVRVLRRFRDQRLRVTPLGRLFVRCYYRVSPCLVAHLGGRSWFTRLLKPPLDTLSAFLEGRGYSNSPYKDARN